MSSPNFIDYVKFCSRSGAGGPGSAHFRREKFVPKGGPDGGDGGRGGHIMLKGNKQLWTLLHLKYKKHVIASNGKPGEGGRRKGADGNEGDDIAGARHVLRALRGFCERSPGGPRQDAPGRRRRRRPGGAASSRAAARRRARSAHRTRRAVSRQRTAGHRASR